MPSGHPTQLQDPSVDRNRPDDEARDAELRALYELTARLQRATSEPEIHEAALDAIVHASGCARASILLFDADDVMRFAAWRGLSDEYRSAVDGHTPWRPENTDARPFGIADLERSDLDEGLKATIRREGIRALAFVPLIGTRRLIGKFMMYHDRPREFGPELDLALAIGAHVALGVERCRAESFVRESERRFAAETDALSRLNAASSRLWRVGSLSEGLEIVLTAAIELLGANFGTIQLVEGDTLRIVAHRGLGAKFLEAFESVSVEDGSVCGRAAGAETRVVIEDVEIDPPFAPWRHIAREAGVRAVQSTPLVARDGRLLGVISTHWAAPHRPTDQDMRRLDLYARQASDFVERCEAEEMLRRSEASLRESERLKDDFIAVLSHELRNPLAPLRSGLELLRLQQLDPSAREVQLMMARQVSHLVRLVDDLMESSRINRGLLQLHLQPVTLAEVLRGAIEGSKSLIQERGHQLEVELPDEPIWMEADPVRLAQCFVNLLNNAAHYTPPGGQIWLSAVKHADDTLHVAVRDNGSGLSADAQSRLFEMFSRGSSSGGLGIGLALVRKLVEMHGGTVEARSDGEGRGSEFTVALRLSTPRSTPANAAPSPRQVESLRVVVADDNQDAAETLAVLLRAIGHDVRVALDGAEALEAARSFRPRVVLLDLGMPRLDGYQAARAIRADPNTRTVYMVALTGWGQENDRARAREAGFDDHLVKPADLDGLQRVLAAAGTYTPVG